MAFFREVLFYLVLSQFSATFSVTIVNESNAWKSCRHIVGLAGPPVKPLDVAVVMPMDGFHLYRSQLDAMENPEEAHAKRGAPWTFDPVLLLNCLKNLRNQGSVYAPSFDHGVGDPTEEISS
ncbi:hypothetical protein PTKIN_Ptkin15bG0111800 [Pterospermum kingtungense]